MAIEFGGNDETLATAGIDGKVRLWPAPGWRALSRSGKNKKDLAREIELRKREYWKSRFEKAPNRSEYQASTR